MEVVVKEEKHRTHNAEQKATVWETRAKQAEEHVHAAEKHLQRLQDEIRALEKNREGQKQNLSFRA